MLLSDPYANSGNVSIGKLPVLVYTIVYTILAEEMIYDGRGKNL